MIDIEKLAKEHCHHQQSADQFSITLYGLKQFAESYAAKVLEDKEREIAELKEKFKCYKEESLNEIVSLNRTCSEYQSNINDLREALVGIIDNDGGDGSKCFDAQILHSSRMKAIKLLSKTPAQNLQSFENEVIEMVASAWTCDCDDCPDNIRALKATNE